MSTIVPYLCCRDAARAMEFYAQAFGAVQTMRLADPSGRIAHAELRIGAAPFFLSDEHLEYGVKSPTAFGGTPVMLHLSVDDVDAVMARAAAAGATIERAAQDQFYGDRTGTLHDPFGHRWMISTRKEALSTDEVERRFSDLMKGS
ncbi:MAG: VOC family protein [Deltaproteobacteria bacterium]|nr:VOC family protein [Deltaproteobacteria bacterium]